MANESVKSREKEVSRCRDSYKLQSIARRISLDNINFESRGFKKVPGLAHCCRTLQGGYDKKTAVPVIKSVKAGRSNFSFAGLQTCGSWSACPVCAKKISFYRGQEIQGAVDSWDQGSVVMLTLTSSHHKGQSLEFARSHFKAARRRFRSQNLLKRTPSFVPFKSLRKRFRIEGSIASQELTYSEKNGWHYHSHELLFCGRKLSPQDRQTLESLCKLAWYRACNQEGITGDNRFFFLQRGCRVTRTDDKASDYLSKFGSWGPAQELTQSHRKRGRGDNLTPWDFLRKIAESDEKEVYLKYGLLFREVISVFFGKQQIFFEKGFKARLGLRELSDQEITDSQEQTVKVYGFIHRDLWRGICRAELRGDLLGMCHMGYEWDAVLQFIKDKLRRKSGAGRAKVSPGSAAA